MTTPTEYPPGVRSGRRTNATFDRRTLLLSAAILVVAIFGGVLAVAALSDPGTPTTPAATADGQARPRIITRPNEGVEPQDPGDRGGWEQLALMGVVLVAVAGIGVLALRGGGAKARANREAWRAAGDSGADGAVPR